MTRLLILGGSDAGISAALRARECDPQVRITVVVADAFPNYSICGLPFYLSGEVSDWQALAHRTLEELASFKITFLLDHTAEAIDPGSHAVRVRPAGGPPRRLTYDRLVIATGAVPVAPPIAGLHLPGVYLLHTMADSFRLRTALAEQQPRSAVIVGTGYIGLEMADALTQRGLRVTLVGRAPTALPTVDAALGQALEAELRAHGVGVCNGVTVESIQAAGGQLLVTGTAEFRQGADLVLVGGGVRPNSDLARAAGVRTGEHGAIGVTREMATNLPDVYAAGDCVATWHRLLERSVYLPLGTTAHKQGRIAGENLVGGHRAFAGSLGTQVVKVFDRVVARTGLREDDARAAGCDPLTTEIEIGDHKAYYPGAQPLCIRLTGDRASGRLLGAQILGPWGAEVAKRIDTVAAALFAGLAVEQLNDLDLSYTPPVSSPWDPVQGAAQAWSQGRAAYSS